tara:strand:+ start:1242 stop:2099 length:858 start_codon:yes stop_codon:yes gene_type:complete
MPEIPSIAGDKLVENIYNAYEAEEKNKTNKLYLGRLGSSYIGNECIRQIWFNWRAFSTENIKGRILRLFETGHLQEERIIVDLRRAGYSVYDKTPDGYQYEGIDDTGHFITKLDGVIKGIEYSNKLHIDQPHILEIKTHNRSSYNAVVKHGVNKSKPTHYSQVQISMKLKSISAAVYIAVCKDDERIYCEIIKEDSKEQDKLAMRIKSIIEATLRPAGISDNASAVACKFCSFKEVCIKEIEPLINCRTCTHSQPIPQGRWACGLNNSILSFDEQRAACSEHERL